MATLNALNQNPRAESEKDAAQPNAGSLIAAALTFLGIITIVTAAIDWCSNLGRKRIFISFAAEDAKYRDFLVQHAEDQRSPFSFADQSLREPFSDRWKTRCRALIRDCDGVIALISHNTMNAEGAKWEMKCANDEGIPLIGLHIHARGKGRIPNELDENEVIEWTWDGIKQFLDSIPD